MSVSDETAQAADVADEIGDDAATLHACVGVVLAGGRSSRMGRNKATLELAGELLLRRVVGRVRQALGTVVVGPEALQMLVPEIPVLRDSLPGAGPLGALATALHALPAEHVFLVGCDMPFVAADLVRAMAQLAAEPPPVDVVLLRSPSGLEYLHAVYARSCLPTVERLLAAGERSLRGLVAAARVREVPQALLALYDPLGRSAFNANTPEEWELARTIAECERTGA